VRVTAPPLDDLDLLWGATAGAALAALAAAGGPSANRGMPKRWPSAVRDTSTPGLFRRVSMGDSDDVSGPARGCLLALAVSCLIWALALAWVLR
jgi:hypothetical protein